MKRTMAAVFAISFATLGLAACSSENDGPSDEEHAVSMCQDEAKDELLDPESAQFRDMTAGDKLQSPVSSEDGVYWKVSGQVNARNQMGGMVGFKDVNCEISKSASGEWTGWARIDKY